MGEPHFHPMRIGLTATVAAGVMLAAIAGCSTQHPTTPENDPLARGPAGPARSAPMAAIVLAAGAGPATDATGRTGPESSAAKSPPNAENQKSFNYGKPLYLSPPQRYLAF
jgi:hypothetical protein